MLRRTILSLFCTLLFSVTVPLNAQVSIFQETHRGSIYISAGINSFALPASTLHVYQKQYSNQYDLLNVKSDLTDDGSTASPLNNYSVNIGYFFNYNQTWAVEFSYNPFNLYISDNQTVHQTGIARGHQVVDTSLVFSSQSGDAYALTSGTAVVQINLVKRIPLYRNKIRNFSADLILKAGLGPTTAHAVNSIDNNANVPAMSINAGLNAGAAGGLRVMFIRHFFAEIYEKYSYINFSNVPLCQGTATQTLAFSAVSISAGYIFSVTKRNPLFRKGVKRKKGLPDGPEPRGDLPQTGSPDQPQIPQ